MVMVTCNACGRVHMAYTLAQAVAEYTSFNAYYEALTPSQQQDYYGGQKSSLEHYTRCLGCGGSYENFRDAKDGDCPDGCTITPILLYKEDAA